MESGTFNNTVKVEWLDEEPRKMRLLEDITFKDSNGKYWIAQAGDIIDGASIPRFFWRVIGSPFVGLFRRASVIHDVYCVSQNRPAQEVHDCFKEMMLADGVPPWKASVMFQAVNIGGPRW